MTDDDWLAIADVERIMGEVGYVLMRSDDDIVMFQHRTSPTVVVSLDIHLGKVAPEDFRQSLMDYGISSDRISTAFDDTGLD